jgi:hypothetical protein
MNLFEHLRKFALRLFEQRCGEMAPGLDGISFPSGSGRSPAEDRRIASHEAGHIVIARSIDAPVALATIEGGRDYDGIVWGTVAMAKDATSLEVSRRAVEKRCAQLAGIMPDLGESKTCVANVIALALDGIIELVAGFEAEEIIVGGAAKAATASGDYQTAWHLGQMICGSASSVPFLIDFARSEARSILLRQKPVLEAVTDALLEHRTLDGDRLDQVIASALVRESADAESVRRTVWAGVLARAAEFEKTGHTE